MNNAIDVLGYSKSYKSKHNIVKAVDNLSFSIGFGKCVGFIGPNGAGKTTTIKSICGILYPDSGSIFVNSINPFNKREELLKSIGIVFGSRTHLNQNFTLEENIKYFSILYGVNNDIYINHIAEKLDIMRLKNNIIRTMSLGEKAKATILISLLHNPRILILDEPFIGIDIFSKEALLDVLKEYISEGKRSVMITSHDLFELENILSDIYIIDKGKLIFGDEINSIRRFKLDIITIQFRNLNDTNELIICETMKKNNIEYSRLEKNVIEFKINKGYTEVLALLGCLNQISEIVDFKKSVLSLQEIIKNIIRG